MAVAAFLLSATPAAAEVGVGISAGTTGVGAELSYQILPVLGLRLDAGTLGLSRSIKVDDIDYDGDVTLRSAGALLDWYPLAGSFRLTAGLRLNGNDIDVQATPGRPVTVGGNTYAPELIGRLEGSVDYDRIAPYAGLGWTVSLPLTGLSFVADLGVMHQGRPEVSLRGTGPVAGDPRFAADIERERRELEDEIDWTRWFPVVKLGLSYRF
ncbi:hypothetical protein [Rhodocista pekingensis]|uniref:Outer membrane protein domain-containing protein n=1 Tax=Rhodocista pekingensis TaxID=201185 RepID=A0ABW2KXM0_9PROT